MPEMRGPQPGFPPAGPNVTEQQILIERTLARLRDRQNLGLGIVGGAIGAVVGALLWALITSATKFQIGWMAVGVGFLAGYGVRLLGKGVDRSFGIAGAVLALLGCLAGNLLTVCILVAHELSIPVGDVLAQLDPSKVATLLKETFSPMDVLFYAIAVWEGYRFSIRPVTPEDLKAGQG